MFHFNLFLCENIILLYECERSLFPSMATTMEVMERGRAENAKATTVEAAAEASAATVIKRRMKTKTKKKRKVTGDTAGGTASVGRASTTLIKTIITTITM